MSVIKALKARRSVYELKRVSPLSNEEIVEVISQSVALTPSAFNAQTQRVAVLFEAESDEFWDLVSSTLRNVMPNAGFKKTAENLESFKAQGTILFYIDSSVVEELQENFVLHKESFPVWAQQENGMLQLVIWSELASLGVGASLQHYNPVIDSVIQERFGIDPSWQLVGQMPFGGIGDVGTPKEHLPSSKTVRVFSI